jgi:hypothetical protein
MNDNIFDKRWKIGLLITPTLLRGFPFRRSMVIGEAIAEAIQIIQQQMSPFAVPTEFDGGYPKLLVDRFGFSFQLRKGARAITDPAKLTPLLSDRGVQLITRICDVLPEP